MNNIEKRKIINDLIDAAYNADCQCGNGGYNISFYSNRGDEIETDINSDMSIGEFREKYTINLFF